MRKKRAHQEVPTSVVLLSASASHLCLLNDDSGFWASSDGPFPVFLCSVALSIFCSVALSFFFSTQWQLIHHTYSCRLSEKKIFFLNILQRPFSMQLETTKGEQESGFQYYRDKAQLSNIVLYGNFMK